MQEIIHIEHSDENLIKGLSYGHTNKIRTILEVITFLLRNIRIRIFRSKAINKF